MTTLTIKIPTEKTEKISNLIRKEGGNVLAIGNDLSKEEQLALNKALSQAQLINDGEMQGLSFDELWD